MKHIEKKAWPDMFEKVLSGDKAFDARLADFDIAEGDTLVLREWDPETKEYTGRVVEKTVTYVLKTKETPFWSDEDIADKGLQVISFR